MTHLRDEGIHRDINEDSIEIVVLLPFGREAYAMKISRALPIGISDGLQEVKRGRREYDKLKDGKTRFAFVIHGDFKPWLCDGAVGHHLGFVVIRPASDTPVDEID